MLQHYTYNFVIRQKKKQKTIVIKTTKKKLLFAKKPGEKINRVKGVIQNKKKKNVQENSFGSVVVLYRIKSTPKNIPFSPNRNSKKVLSLSLFLVFYFYFFLPASVCVSVRVSVSE